MGREQHWAIIAYEDDMLNPGPTAEDWEVFYAARRANRSYEPVLETRNADQGMNRPYGEQFDPDILEEALDLGVFGSGYQAWREHIDAKKQ